MCMMRFAFKISCVPGKDLTIADALSCAPVSSPTVVDDHLEKETTAYIQLVIQHLPVIERRLHEIQQCQVMDPVCQKLVNFCKSGWPDRNILSADVKPLYTVAAQLLVKNGLLLCESCILIPPPLMKTLLNKLHSGHQGGTKYRELTRQSIWWSGLVKQLEELVLRCPECMKAQRQSKVLHSPYSPTTALAKVATDLFEWKHATYFSRFIIQTQSDHHIRGHQ